jgi:hypothetical protein
LSIELAGNLAAAAYVGSRGDRVAFVIPNINLAPVGPGTIDPRRRFFDRLPRVTTIGLFADDFESAHDALQLVFQRRYRDGFTFSTHYTMAQTEWTQLAPWDINVTERFNADFDVRHRWGVTANYELPFGRSMTSAARHLVAGWQINAVASWQSGLPFNITNLASRTNTGGADRPNQIGDPAIDNPTITRWFNTAAFEAQPVNTVGTSTVARNSLHGPPQRRIDMSLFKNVALMGTARLAAARRGVQHHEHAQLRESERSTRERGVRDDQQHGGDAEADAVCGEAAVLRRLRVTYVTARDQGLHVTALVHDTPRHRGTEVLFQRCLHVQTEFKNLPRRLGASVCRGTSAVTCSHAGTRSH